jgi:hypothetical protein
MAMPEAAMDEDRETMAGQNDVRPARQIGAVKAESGSKGMECSSHGLLGQSVLPADPRHQR